MRLTTRTKIFLASIPAKGILFLRRLLGRSPEGDFKRKGLWWRLDLGEGIDFAIYLFGGFEGTTQRAYRKRIAPGDIVLDIGANIGAHTLPLAQCVWPEGKVFAFEATQYAISKLNHNLELNRELQQVVEVNHCLLTDGQHQIDVQAIHSSWPLTKTVDDGHPQHGGHLQSVGTKEQYSIDQFVQRRDLQRIDFVKLDVDGFEWPILQGMRHVMERFHPTFIIELAPDYSGVSLEQILQFFWDRDYDFHTLSGKRRFPRNAKDIRKDIPEGGSINASVIWHHPPSAAE